MSRELHLEGLPAVNKSIMETRGEIHEALLS